MLTPGSVFLTVFRKVEPIVADITGRITGTPVVLGQFLESERVTLSAMRTVNHLRGNAMHRLMLPTSHDVAAVRRDLEKIRSSLAEIEARLEDQRTREDDA